MNDYFVIYNDGSMDYSFLMTRYKSASEAWDKSVSHIELKHQEDTCTITAFQKV